jgi:hypothetical protein
MSFDDKDFVGLIDSLSYWFGDFEEEGDAADFIMSGDADSYLKQYNIDLVEPEDFNVSVNPEKVPTRMPDIGGEQGPSMDEVARMKKLAGLLEEDKIEKTVLNPGLVFKSEGFRNTAAKWLQNPANYSKLAKESKMSEPPFKFEMKDSTGIKFPASENNIDPERLKKILENLTKKMPNALGASVTEYKND